MAKRTPRSEANDPAAGPAKPRPRAAGAKKKSAASGPANGAAPTDDTGIADDAGLSGVSDTTSMSMSSEPSDEDIRLRAYQRYLERGGGHGMDFEDWLEAERELKRRP